MSTTTIPAISSTLRAQLKAAYLNKKPLIVATNEERQLVLEWINAKNEELAAKGREGLFIPIRVKYSNVKGQVLKISKLTQLSQKKILSLSETKGNLILVPTKDMEKKLREKLSTACKGAVEAGEVFNFIRVTTVTPKPIETGS